MKTISLCMIVKNEEKVLGRCLDSIKGIADEVIITDTGSKDNTKKIAEKYTKKIFDYTWNNNFSKARNYSFSKATMDYILWLDADDVMLNKDSLKLKKLKQKIDGSYDAYSMIYNYAFDNYNRPSLSFRRNRLVKSSKNFMWFGAVHEYLDVQGEIENTDICITHKRINYASDRNLSIYNEMLARGEKLSTRDLYYYAKELYDHELYEQAKDIFLKFLEKEDAWFENQIIASLKLANYFFALGQYNSCRKYCYKTFEFDTPRPEACCQIGLAYMAEKKWEEAIYWYSLSTQLNKQKEWQYVNEACHSWLPHLQLCVCYFHQKNYKKAYKHNEIASSFCPKHESILHNRMLLKSVKL